jgi:predicted nuclease with TOPRIM domain
MANMNINEQIKIRESRIKQLQEEMTKLKSNIAACNERLQLLSNEAYKQQGAMDALKELLEPIDKPKVSGKTN